MVDVGSDVFNCISDVDFEVQIMSVTFQLVYGYIFCCACLDVLLFILCWYVLVVSSQGLIQFLFVFCCMILYLLTICNQSPVFSRLFQCLELHSSGRLCCHGFKTISRYLNVVVSCILNSIILIYVCPYLHLVFMLDCHS